MGIVGIRLSLALVAIILGLGWPQLRLGPLLTLVKSKLAVSSTFSKRLDGIYRCRWITIVLYNGFPIFVVKGFIFGIREAK